jgi:hypothetical protein
MESAPTDETRGHAMSITVQVECYSGYTYAQEPRAFVWRGERYEVQRIVKRWRTPAGPAFRVKVAQPKSQISTRSVQSQIPGLVDLQYVEIEDQWTMAVHNTIQEDQR